MEEGKENAIAKTLHARLRQLEKSQKTFRGIVNSALVAAILTTAGGWYYLFRQTSFTRRSVEESELIVNAFHTNQLPKIQSFIKQLQGFAQTNADFAPILLRHRVASPGSGVQSGESAAPWDGPSLPTAE